MQCFDMKHHGPKGPRLFMLVHIAINSIWPLLTFGYLDALSSAYSTYAVGNAEVGRAITATARKKILLELHYLDDLQCRLSVLSVLCFP